MEFNNLKGFWNAATMNQDSSIDLKATPEISFHNSNSNNDVILCSEVQADILEEITPEVTSEGYGLKTPYGTHLNLDFVKFCENLGQNFKRTTAMQKTRLRSTSSSASNEGFLPRGRLTGGPSSESLDSMASDGRQELGRNVRVADTTLMETRRRLEAFRSFRSNRNKSSGDNMLNGPTLSSSARNGYGTHVGRRGSVSPCSSSSGNTTPNSHSSTMNTSQQGNTQHLQVVRNQMASALLRLKELEEQVKKIPDLQLKISTLQEEKKNLLDKLKTTRQNHSYSERTDSTEESHRINVRTGSRKKFSSTSSGVYSSSQSTESSPRSPLGDASFQSRFAVQRSNSHEPPLLSPKIPKSGIPPPPPPKRRYRSVAVGDPTPVEEVVCYSRRSSDVANVGLSCNIPPKRKESVDFSSIVKELDIDAAFDIFPPAPKQFTEAATCTTTTTNSLASSSQTEERATSLVSTQTVNPRYKTTGCGSGVVVEVRDNSCDPIPRFSRDISVMTCAPPKLTKDQATTSYDLIHKRSAGVGNHVISATVGTSTPRLSCVAKATTCDGLVRFRDVPVGPDRHTTWTDASVATDVVRKSNVSVECRLPMTPQKQMADKITMTLATGGRWISYANMVHIACGSDKETLHLCKSTETNQISVADKKVGTVKPRSDEKATMAKIQRSTSHICTNTDVIAKYDQGTDCKDIKPVLRHVATLTNPPKWKSVATQYAITKANLVDAATNTAIPSTLDATTETEDTEKTKDIDSYVDKVQTLLAEQQTLLAENYDVFTDEWEKKDKVSRFVNPAFLSSTEQEDDAEKEEGVSSSTSPAISASLSLLSTQERKESSSTCSGCESDTEDEYDCPPLRPLPCADCEKELKSIMKKPGTPSREKKFLRFAEGVKSDDSDSSSDEDSSSEEEEEEEKNEREEKKERKEIKREVTAVKIRSASKKQEIVVLIEDKEFNYSNEFVKKVDKIKESKDDRGCLNEKEIENKDKKEKEAEIELTDIRPVVEGAEDTCNVYPENNNIKYIFTTEVLDACDVLEKHLRNPKLVDKTQVASATSAVREEWFRVAAKENSSKNLLEDFVSDLADTSLPVLRKVVNMTDSSGNTVLHYAMSHGNIRIADSLLSIEELDVNKANNCGYTAAMLAALYDVKNDSEIDVFKKLFAKSNVNMHAKEAGQTALMLAASHGKTKTAQLLLTYGADVNAKDDDGSTALMCAAQHGELEAVKLLLSKSNCDASSTDADGSTALSIALEGGYSDIAILLYAQVNFKPTARSPKPRAACKSMIPSPLPKPVKS